MDQTINGCSIERRMELYLGTGVWTNFDFYLFMLSVNRARTDRFWPARGARLGQWLRGFRKHMQQKGIPIDRWAFYVADEPATGAPREATSSATSFRSRASPYSAGASMVMSCTATAAPSSANRRAMARPRPRPEPVTSAT